MPQDESKLADPVKEEAEKQLAADKAKQPAVESESEDDDVADADGDHEADAAQGAESSAAGAAKKKKKKSKRKKLKDALTGKSSDPDADKKEAIDKLTPKQIQDFMAFNPALAQEVNALAGGSSSGSVDPARAAELLKKLKLEDVMTGLASTGKNVKDMASYKFWQTQPVPRFDDAGSSKPIEEGPIRVQSLDEVPKEPAPLGIEGFEWATVDIEDPAQIKEVYELLNGHFVEDNEAMFRFNYGTSTLKWAMMPPGWKKEWHVGIRTTSSKRLVAFISAIPVELRLRDKVLHSSEVNFMVVHKKLRSKRLAPVLIKEITRLCNQQGVWQAIYTAGVVLPKPVSTCRYYHRALNWQKLYEVGFSPLPPNSKPQYQIRKYHLPEQTSIKGLREMKSEDVPAVLTLLKRYLRRYEMTPEWNEEEAEHWLLPKVEQGDEQFVWSFVVEDENKKITDFVSFYSLESTVINNPRHSVIRAAYLYYYATEVGLTEPVDKKALKTRLNELVHDQLILAKRHRFDVFNALSLMDNGLFLEEQKFGGGDGQLHYYLFNYRANPVAGGINRRNQLDEDGLSGIGFVML
ncbi:putative glycylpeptide n-tetradecanoyltransferase protein [Phaeoacremonium minimum UCRPA7]|uniref:Glycylpeptide N-tetradecanoyltransferase n=1 Tax=Phaeoacremonium minimum (strain UCR-PA7) TaxID=1286976 RepID=R8BCQ8_PHAM7|nr:putative glycylpeptide n-tetradecanoyltransferase protein [Phaeoacremonium minimum UCRPA7]EON97088.1 putative glycylpeptide n-tetradecanoyltransferase protein [Phaeoacremonium minimum UCRPA7]